MGFFGKLFLFLVIMTVGATVTCGGNLYLLSLSERFLVSLFGDGATGFLVLLWAVELILIFVWAVRHVFFSETKEQKTTPTGTPIKTSPSPTPEDSDSSLTPR